MSDEPRSGAPEDERTEHRVRIDARPLPLRSGVLQSMVAEARLITTPGTPAAADG